LYEYISRVSDKYYTFRLPWKTNFLRVNHLFSPLIPVTYPGEKIFLINDILQGRLQVSCSLQGNPHVFRVRVRVRVELPWRDLYTRRLPGRNFPH
jgi:hypothetical protein